MLFWITPHEREEWFARLSTHVCIFVPSIHRSLSAVLNQLIISVLNIWNEKFQKRKETLISTQHEACCHCAALLKQPTAVSLQVCVRGIPSHWFIKEQRDGTPRVQHIWIQSDITDSFYYFKMPYLQFKSLWKAVSWPLIVLSRLSWLRVLLRSAQTYSDKTDCLSCIFLLISCRAETLCLGNRMTLLAWRN